MSNESHERKIRVFISSVQVELEPEREAASSAITENPELDKYFVPELYEYEPASSALAIEQCVEHVGRCQVYILIVGQKAGCMVGGRSITHAEFLKACDLHKAGKMKILVFRKTVRGTLDKGASALLDDVVRTGVKYKEFGTLKAFRAEYKSALSAMLRDSFSQADLDLVLSPSEPHEHASRFESELSLVPMTELDFGIAQRMIAVFDGLDASKLTKKETTSRLLGRGHLQRDDRRRIVPRRLGALVLAKDPTIDINLVNAVIVAEAYPGTAISARPRDQKRIHGHAGRLVDEALDFVARNTRHPDRVIGHRRFTLDEYPREAVREAIVNAIAHRDYQDTGSSIRLQLFSDRILVGSPGLTPSPLTPQRLKTGEARPRSRNPLLAQSLYRLGLMENRGSGIRRINEYVGNGQLKGFDIRGLDGYLELTLFGPGDAIDSLPLPRELLEAVLPPSRRNVLNERQLAMAERLGRGETLTSRTCEAQFGITRETATKDFKSLIEAGVAERVGDGRSTRYILAGLTSQSSGDRQE